MKYSDVTLGRIEAVWNKLGGEEGVDRFLRGEFVLENKFLKRIARVAVGGAKWFVPKDHIQSANIGRMDDGFRMFFLDKVEENVNGTIIVVHQLEKDSLDVSILAELGDHAQISLAHFFELLEKQSKGESGQLLTNGYAMIAYIIDKDGNTRAVNAIWSDARRYWVVYANLVESPSRWHEGHQVLSRDS